MTNFRSYVAAGVLFLGTVVACLILAYGLVWAFALIGGVWKLAAEDLDAMTLVGLLLIVLAVCGFVAKYGRTK